MKNYLSILLLITISLGVLTIGLNKPLNGHHDWNNRYFSAIARNYVHYGPLKLSFGQLIGDSSPESRNYYTHHPQLFPLILAIFVGVLGYYNWVIRLVPVLFSVGTVVIFYLLLRKFYSLQASVISSLFMIATPMFMYFGKMANHEVFTLFFILLTVFYYLGGKFRLSLLTIFLGQWIGWPAYYLAGILFLISKKKAYLVLSLFNFILFILNVYFLTGSMTGGGLGEVLFFRMGFTNLPFVHEEYTNWQLFIQELRWIYRFFMPIQVLLILPALLFIKKSKANLVWVVFGLVAILHVVLFRTGAWRHDYWLYYFLPFISWGIAAGIDLGEKIYSGKYKYGIYAVYLLLLLVGIWQSQPFFWALQNMVDNSI